MVGILLLVLCQLKSMSELFFKLLGGNVGIDLKVGYNVEYDCFGKGKVIKLEGSGEDCKVMIFFL